MDEKKLTENDSLLLIEQMIGVAKKEERASGWGWVVWGWLLFIASIAHYILIKIHADEPSRVWDYFGIAAVILILTSVVMKYFNKGRSNVTTYTNELVDKFGLAFFISLFLITYGNMVTGVNRSGVNFGYLLLLYAFWMYIHGAAFRFNLLRYGAFANWAGALLIFFAYEKLSANVLLVHALCVALGYLIPGHVAMYRYKRGLS